MNKMLELGGALFGSGFVEETNILKEYLETINGFHNGYIKRRDEIIAETITSYLRRPDISDAEFLAKYDFDSKYLVKYPQTIFSGFIFSVYSLLERSLLEICELLDLEIAVRAKDRFGLGTGVYKARKFLLTIGYEIDNISWNEINNLSKLRNYLAHNGFSIGIGSGERTIDKGLEKYLIKHELLRMEDGSLTDEPDEERYLVDIVPTYKYCVHILQKTEDIVNKILQDLIFSKLSRTSYSWRGQR